MMRIARRGVLAGVTAVTMVGRVGGPASAQSATGQGLLKRLQEAKKIRVGIANQPPFSAMNPDGTMTGVAPTISKIILGRLGIPVMEGFIADYGQLVPGMLAGRWDFISASLTITKARCSQVLYADPLIYDGSALFYKAGKRGTRPKSVADIIKMNVPIGTQAGGADLRTVLAAGVAPGNVIQFTSDQALLDGLLADRMEYALTAYSALKTVLRQRNITNLEIVYPVPDDPPKGSSCAFRLINTELHAAYQKELRAMKASGEFLSVLHQYGYDTTPALMSITDKEACAQA
jgi:polar amino acid transport system substrate-binding protein